MKQGFTLIELLVVITILAILAALVFTSYEGAQKSARDGQRKSDLNQYRAALENYALNNSGKYLTGNCSMAQANVNTMCDPNSANNPIVTEYLPALLKDPTNLGQNYVYDSYPNDDGTNYSLRAQLETGDYWEVCSDGRADKMATTNGNLNKNQCCAGNLSCP